MQPINPKHLRAILQRGNRVAELAANRPCLYHRVANLQVEAKSALKQESAEKHQTPHHSASKHIHVRLAHGSRETLSGHATQNQDDHPKADVLLRVSRGSLFLVALSLTSKGRKRRKWRERVETIVREQTVKRLRMVCRVYRKPYYHLVVYRICEGAAAPSVPRVRANWWLSEVRLDCNTSCKSAAELSSDLQAKSSTSGNARSGLESIEWHPLLLSPRRTSASVSTHDLYGTWSQADIGDPLPLGLAVTVQVVRHVAELSDVNCRSTLHH